MMRRKIVGHEVQDIARRIEALEIDRAYAELARVADVGGRIIVTDFHTEAHAAGHRRSFRAEGVVHEVEHYVHSAADHVAAARAAGLNLVDRQEAMVGPEVREVYARAGWPALFREHFGLPLVLALAFVAALGPGIENAVLAIAITSWPPYARIARAEMPSSLRNLP